MKTPKQKRIPVNVSLPVDFYMHLEEIWRDRWNKGHTMLRLREFIGEMIGEGFQVWESKNLPQAPEEEPPEKTGPALADNEVWDFPRNNRRPLLRFGGEQ
ncbi:hypothetical protein AGMMS49942_19780 [Spirochaetia bacterium]|nr:hypothetical protein AGMMS49942_19780 [Spirochaetia bacterium]